ncbi:HPr(Ser) kinase/phosphatase [Sporosalibacterium faouarense]|uniref:HPr(Ser) kinase/phosphatase n=1 Tax=Sporosalibacterium faouarense TaxID=516123 RepID=UPI00141CBCF6|nr:HPr(Ser) kinase/phosphatase [Sporosalibacterium faouarense]MTI47323.1 HPr kinase/phosphorylase [Bacillota bacterium]
MNGITIDQFAEELDLEIIYRPDNPETKITTSDLNRPGIQLTGYFEYFPHKRLQIIGKVEWNYLATLGDKEKERRIEEIFKYPIPGVVITRELEVYPEIIQMAKKYNRTILRTDIATTKFINKIINYLDDVFAPKTTMHGVLVEVFGMGVLILGKSGVGKSETALELVKRGHRLVADDAVEIKRIEDGILKGTSPELIRHFLEIRGIGIIDIKRLYGVGAVKTWEAIDLVIELEFWDEKKEYDRLGMDEQYAQILKVDIPKYVIPVKPGRNLAMIIEVAARNNREKQMGYNAAQELSNKVLMEMEK